MDIKREVSPASLAAEEMALRRGHSLTRGTSLWEATFDSIGDDTFEGRGC